MGGLVPVENTADEGGDEVGTGLSGGDSLGDGEHQGQVGVDAVVALKDLGGLDTLPGGGDLDQDAVLGDALGLVQLGWLLAKLLKTVQRRDTRRTSMMCRALSTEALVSNERLASTSVETLPGTTLRISLPNSTRRASRALSTCSSTEPPCFLAEATASSISLAYSAFLEAARMREGLVVASWGLYLAMAV